MIVNIAIVSLCVSAILILTNVMESHLLAFAIEKVVGNVLSVCVYICCSLSRRTYLWATDLGNIRILKWQSSRTHVRIVLRNPPQLDPSHMIVAFL